MKAVTAALLAAMLTPVEVALASCASLRVEHAWIRLPPPHVRHVAAYADISNDGTSTAVISAVSSTDFADAMLHEVRYTEGRAEMRHLEVLELAAGATVAIAPGSTHIMLQRDELVLDAGMLLELRLECADGTSHNAWFQVRRDAP